MVGEIGRNVEHGQQGHTTEERSGNVAFRIPDLLGHRRDPVPAVVGPHDREQHQAEPGPGRQVSCRLHSGAVVGPVDSGLGKGGHEKRQKRQQPQERGLDQGRGSLHPSSPEDSPDVDPGQEKYETEGQEYGLRLTQRPAQREAESAREGHRQGSDAGGAVEEKLVPAEEEGGRFSVGLLEKHVDAPSPGQHGGQLGEAEGAQDTDGAAQQPSRQDRAEVSGFGGDAPRLEEDPGTDDVSHHDGQSNARSQGPPQARPGTPLISRGLGWHRFTWRC